MSHVIHHVGQIVGQGVTFEAETYNHPLTGILYTSCLLVLHHHNGRKTYLPVHPLATARNYTLHDSIMDQTTEVSLADAVAIFTRNVRHLMDAHLAQETI
jgi:hypothetical protein